MPIRITLLRCKNTQEYIWNKLEGLPLVHRGLLFARNSTFAEPFAELIAERLEVYLRTYETATALPKKCVEHFFPKPETKVSQK